MTADALKDCNKKHLAQMAKEQGISGWHAMRKDQLIRALTLTRSSPRLKKDAKSLKRQPPARKAALRKQSANHAEVAVAARRPARMPSASGTPVPHTLDHACQKDRIIVLAR